jgi:signal transduction histidine kinase
VKELLLKIRKHIDRQETIKQLMAREQEQDTAMQCLVHELKGSIHVIGGFSSHALRQDASNKHLQTINTVASHAERLLRDATPLSRLETRGKGLSIKHVDIDPMISEPADVVPNTRVAHQLVNAASLISEIAETARILIGNKPVSVEVREPSLSVMINTDSVRLRQILINLVSNAAKYTEEGKIVITLSVIGSWMEIAISDTGVGIKEEDFHKLFTNYGRIEDAKTKEQGGAGLGLSISKNLAELLGGTISVTSSYGKGTTFVVSLPLQQVNSQRGLYSAE